MKRMLLLFVVAALTACASMPDADTMNKRMALVEIGYSAVLDTIALHDREGRLSIPHKRRIAQHLRDINEARDLAYVAIRAGNEADFSTRIATMNTGLAVLRTLLTEIEGRKSDVHIQRDHGSGFDIRHVAGCCRGQRAVAARPG